MKRLNQRVNHACAALHKGSLERIMVVEANLMSTGLLDVNDGWYALTDKGQKLAAIRWRQLPDEDKLLFTLHVMDMDLPQGEERDAEH